jgi:hypothetical protein
MKGFSLLKTYFTSVSIEMFPMDEAERLFHRGATIDIAIFVFRHEYMQHTLEQ